jgi:hypothetical protein
VEVRQSPLACVAEVTYRVMLLAAAASDSTTHTQQQPAPPQLVFRFPSNQSFCVGSGDDKIEPRGGWPHESRETNSLTLPHRR